MAQNRNLTGEAELSKLDVWLIASSDLIQATSSLCQATVINPEDWQDQLLDRRPSFALVEGREHLAEAWVYQLGEFLKRCEQENIPRFLWITASPFDPGLLQHLPHFSRVFTVDWDQRADLTNAKARNPSLLWPGTTLSYTEKQPPGPGERPEQILWSGGWRSDWPETWRNRLLLLLEAAAEWDLRVAASTGSEQLPRSLLTHIDDTPSLHLNAQLLRARIVIAADTRSPSPSLAPRVAFDAMMSGAAVITPHSFALPYSFSQGSGRNGRPWQSLAPTVVDRETAASAIDRFLTDDDFSTKAVNECRDIVRFNHTHAHRLATLASAADIRVVHSA